MRPPTDRRIAAARTVSRFIVAALVYGSAAFAYRAASGHSDQPPLVGVVAVTALVAVLLWLLEDPLERLSARAVLGDRADGYRVIRTLTQRLAGTLSVDEVAPRVAEAAGRTTGRRRAEVRLWLTGGRQWSQSWPPAAAPIGSGTAVGVRHAGTRVGEIAVDTGEDRSADALSPLDRRLLDDLARPAGLALSTVRLTLELRQRKVELERLTDALRASRARLLTARVREQRRMRARVAERVSPHLAGALDALDVPDASAVTTEVLDRIGSQAGAALDELRSIARGIYPPTLSEDGLAASLEGWLGRSGVEATLQVPAELPAIHGRPELEAGLYFGAVTLLAELSAHEALGIRLAVTQEPEPLLRIEAHVTGLVEMATLQDVTDRIEALGGTVRSGLEGDRFLVTAVLAGPAPDGEPRP